jgi:hypothetical protein
MAGSPFSIELPSVDDPVRANTCRQMAAEACALADAASTPESRDAYLDLHRQWTALADEIENAQAQGKPIPKRDIGASAADTPQTRNARPRAPAPEKGGA